MHAANILMLAASPYNTTTRNLVKAHFGTPNQSLSPFFKPESSLTYCYNATYRGEATLTTTLTTRREPAKRHEMIQISGA